MLTQNRRWRYGCRAAGGLLILGIMAGGATRVGAQQHQSPLPTFRQLYWNEIKQKLGLTDEQVTTLQDLREANRTTMQKDFQALRTSHQALRAAWDQADANAISSAARQVQAAREQLFTDRLQGQLAILNALGPDRWKQWTVLQRHRRGMHGGRGSWMGG